MLVSLKTQLDKLEFPQRPPGAFMLYKEIIQKAKKNDHKSARFVSTKDYCKTLKRDYDSLSEQERSKYETLSQ